MATVIVIAIVRIKTQLTPGGVERYSANELGDFLATQPGAAGQNLPLFRIQVYIKGFRIWSHDHLSYNSGLSPLIQWHIDNIPKIYLCQDFF